MWSQIEFESQGSGEERGIGGLIWDLNLATPVEQPSEEGFTQTEVQLRSPLRFSHTSSRDSPWREKSWLQLNCLLGAVKVPSPENCFSVAKGENTQIGVFQYYYFHLGP